MARPKIKDEKDLRSAHMTLLLTPTTKDAIKDAAWQQRISANELICQILERYIVNQQREKEGA